MNTPRPNSFSDRIRAAWLGEAPPDLSALLTGLEPSEPDIVDGVVEDAEERWERGLPATVEHYRSTLGATAGIAEVTRALLMVECSRRLEVSVAALRSELNSRLPDDEDEITAVIEMIALMRPAAAEAQDRAAGDDLVEGATLGKYRLVEWLGAGTFGEVWSAWDSTLERYVALKLLPPDGTDGTMLASVLREAKSAASIDHENVVKVHDAGRFEDGRRCYIDTQLAGDPSPLPGDPKRVAVGRALSALVLEIHPRGMRARDAARLLESISRGVAAAHARGIVHRDIKPSNILVTPSGRPMLGDFGLSLLSGLGDTGMHGDGRPSAASAAATRAGRVTGTPAFMSPEQARGEPVTPASDIYALGATLRFVLTGRLPFEPSKRSGLVAPLDVIEQVKSGALRPLREESPELPADIAAICDRAMASFSTDRYVSAQALAEDLRAFLDHRPVAARPAGVARSAALLVARNKAIAGLASMMLIAGAFGLWRYIVNIGRERDRAVSAEAATALQLSETERARASAQSVNDFLQDILGAADPQLLGQNATVLDAVRLVTPDIERRFGAEPLVEADVRETVGYVYGTLGQRDAAKEHLSRALSLRRSHLGEKAAATFSVRHLLAKIEEDQVHQGATGDAIEALVKEMRESLGPDHRITLVAELTLVDVLASRHRLQEAVDLASSIMERRKKIGDADTLGSMAAEQLRAALLAYVGDPDESIRLLWELADRQRRVFGLHHYRRYSTMIDLAFSLKQFERWEEAAAVYREALEGLRPQLPAGHEQMLVLARGLANILSTKLGRPQEALDALNPIYQAYVARPDHSPFQVTSAHDILGVCYLKLGRFAEAESELLTARDGYVRKMGNSSNDSVRAIDRFLAQTYDALGQAEKACEYRESGRVRTWPANPPGR